MRRYSLYHPGGIHHHVTHTLTWFCALYPVSFALVTHRRTTHDDDANDDDDDDDDDAITRTDARA